jgi:quinolinate synthase
LDIKKSIRQLVKAKNAIVLAHSYQPAEIYDIADFIGDSFELAKIALESSAEIIVFCGVKFMAESTKILNSHKKVLLPEPDAGCALADALDITKLRQLKKQHPKALAVCYINSTAAIKAECHVVVTSANAVKIVKKIPAQEIIFVPDQNLGQFVAQKIPEKKIILFPGNCPVHAEISVKEIKLAQKKFPQAKLMAHPECLPKVQELADQVCGTSGMLKFAKKSSANEFIIATESGMCEKLRRDLPQKKFYHLNKICPEMKKISLAKVLSALETETPEVFVEEKIAVGARQSLERML